MRIAEVARKMALLAVLALAALPAVSVYAAENMVPNPGFEEEASPGVPAAWVSKTKLSQAVGKLVDDVKYSGKYAAMLSIPTYAPPGGDWSKVTYTNEAIYWETGLLPVDPAFGKVEVSAMLKADNVVPGEGANWYRLRFQSSFYDQAGKRLRAVDMFVATGTFDWEEIKRTVDIPAGTKTMKVTVSLTACTGTVWIDDVSARGI